MSFAAQFGSKYGNNGLFHVEKLNHLNLPEELKATLAHNMNHALAKNTWSSYNSGIKKLEEFAVATGTTISLPMQEETILAFSAWILNTGVSAATLETYLCSLRMLHLTEGTNPPQLRTQLVSTVLKGKKNIDMFRKRTGATNSRLPMTPSLLRLLKLELRDSERNLADKRMIWCAATVAFSAGLRGGEFLCHKASVFDPDTALRWKDMKLDTFTVHGEALEILKLKLRAEKQNHTNTSTICDIYPSQSSLCPIRAFKAWKLAETDAEPDLPAFRFHDGPNMTIGAFNKILKETLAPHTKNLRGSISSHSFRIGLASCLGSLGFSDEQVMAAGRWSSRAYQSYMKLPRTKRLEMARAIAKTVH